MMDDPNVIPVQHQVQLVAELERLRDHLREIQGNIEKLRNKEPQIS